MKIFFATVQLTDWANYPAQGVSVNGQTVFEAVDIVRASAQRFFWRGNDSVTLQFTVSRKFATLLDAQVYLLTAFSLLPKFGVVQITCGGPGGGATQDVFMDNAVLTATPIGNNNGVETVIQFTIQGGSFYTAGPSPFVTEDMIQRGKTAIANNVDTVAVLFAQAFPPGTNVIVTAGISKPSGAGSNIFATVREDLVSVNGFTAELSGPTPDANYKLDWMALAG